MSNLTSLRERLAARLLACGSTLEQDRQSMAPMPAQTWKPNGHAVIAIRAGDEPKHFGSLTEASKLCDVTPQAAVNGIKNACDNGTPYKGWYWKREKEQR